MTSKNNIYPQLYPDIRDWPIYKLYEDRDELITAINEEAFNRLNSKFGERIGQVIARTAYLELIRLEENPLKVDPPNEKQFWQRVKKELTTNAKHREDEEYERNKELLRRIIHRYSIEIAGNFNEKTLRFARRFLTAFFKWMLNAAAGGKRLRILGGKKQLYERLQVIGDIDRVRETFKNCTMVIVPTHFSNLDSILIGYALDAVVGLPSFSYGAGLNLYESEIISYFMSRLGAYRVDRRKRNPIYLESLKSMSDLSLQRSVNSLFFPGGTRSRSGSIETQLKMGLLNSLVEAQRKIYEKGNNQKIVVLPLTISYHFVLEAKSLINQYLEKAGEEKFILQHDEFKSRRKLLKFVWQFFSRSSEIYMSFGVPMDILGHEVDTNGTSYDDRGKAIDIREYFLEDGALKANRQREAVYTRHLAERIVESFYRCNVVLSSHIVAYVSFRLLQRMYPDLDLFGLIRLPSDDFIFPAGLLQEGVGQMQKVIIEYADNGKLRIPDVLREVDPETVVRDGISRLGVFHTRKPLRIDKNGQIVSESFKLLFYYHNRLQNFNLESVIQWDDQSILSESESR